VANLGLVVSEAAVSAPMEMLGVTRYLSFRSRLRRVGRRDVRLVPLRRASSLSLAGVPRVSNTAILGHPDWTAVASNTLMPHFVASKGFLVLTVALIGTTITPYMQLYQASAVVERGAGPEDLRDIRIDSVSGSLFASVISISIIVATASAIGGSGPLGSASDAAEALRPVAGSAAVTLFAVGLLGASLLAAAVVPLATSYALAEAVGVERSVSRRFRDAKLFLGLFTAQLAIGSLIALAPGSLIRLLLGTQVLNGLVARAFSSSSWCSRTGDRSWGRTRTRARSGSSPRSASCSWQRWHWRSP
jgi:hypothetical protein